MLLQPQIGARIRQLREDRRLTQEDLAAKAHSDAATLSKIESGRRNITSETLGFFLIALGISAREFFDTKEFGRVLAYDADAPETVNSEHFSVEDVGDSAQVSFRSGAHDASVDLKGLTTKKITEAVLTLRKMLRQAEITGKVDGNGGKSLRASQETATAKSLMSAAIAESFLSIVTGNPVVNPSDVWRYIIGPAFCDPQNHPASSARKNFEQSFKRTGGWALERILVAHYDPYLSQHGVSLTKSSAQTFLAEMGLAEKVPLDKIDLFVAAKQGDRLKPFGVVHVKSSIAERRTDDVPASKLVLEAGYLSVFVTLDTKDQPSSNPINRGEYGPALVYDPTHKRWKGSQKRKDVEIEGSFGGVFSFNSRTVESPEKTPSGFRIQKVNFSNPDDALTRFLLNASGVYSAKMKGKKT